MGDALKWAQRQRRIMGRIVNGKTVPTYTYRWDSRAPAAIRATGFQPWHGPGTLTLIQHVNNAMPVAGPTPGTMVMQLAKYHSQFVSTGAYGMIQRLDPTFAQQVLGTNLYRITTSIAAATGPFRDANDTFDKAGIDRPYSTQREWVKEGGVPQNAILEYMTGATYFAQYDMTNGAPAETALTGWQAF